MGKRKINISKAKVFWIFSGSTLFSFSFDQVYDLDKISRQITREMGKLRLVQSKVSFKPLKTIDYCPKRGQNGPISVKKGTF